MWNNYWISLCAPQMCQCVLLHLYKPNSTAFYYVSLTNTKLMFILRAGQWAKCNVRALLICDRNVTCCFLCRRTDCGKVFINVFVQVLYIDIGGQGKLSTVRILINKVSYTTILHTQLSGTKGSYNRFNITRFSSRPCWEDSWSRCHLHKHSNFHSDILIPINVTNVAYVRVES